MVTIVILGIVFLCGATVGVLALVCTSIGGEESDDSLYKAPPTRSAAATRRLLGWHGIATMQANGPTTRPRVTAAR